jgi:hypothetical protein
VQPSTTLPSESRSVDIAYIDGEHAASCVAVDSLLVWPLVKPGGNIIWDDLGLTPGAGVELGLRYFLPMIEGRYEVLFRNWQLGIKKAGS